MLPLIAPDAEGEALPEPEVLEKQKNWTRKVQEMLLGFKNYKPDRELIDLFLAEDFDFKIYNMYGHELIMNLIQHFQAGVTQPHRPLCVKYFKIIRKLYMMFTEINKQVFHKNFINEWQHYPIDYTPYFESLIVDYKEKIEEMLREVAKNPDNVDACVREELRFLILVTPVATLLKLCTAAIKNSQLVHFVVSVCQGVPKLFEDNRKLAIYHNEYETSKLEPLMAVVFRRLIFNCRLVTTTDEQWKNLEEMAMTLCAGDKPLLCIWVLLDLVFCEIYTDNRIPTKSVETLTGIASAILSPPNKASFNWRFATSVRTKPTERVYLTPTIIDMTLKLMVDYHEKMRYEVVENCKAILQGLGNRMREEDAEFDEETKEYLMTKIQELPWWIEYTMSTWFWALNIVKRRVPSALFKAICLDEVDDKTEVKEEEEESEEEMTDSEDEDDESRADSTERAKRIVAAMKITDKFEAIQEDPEDSNIPIPELYLRSILEIGFYDVECALELLHTECFINFNDSEELQQLLKKLIKECFWVKIGLNGYEDARILLLQILEIFVKESADEHEKVVSSLLEQVRVYRMADDTPLFTLEIKPSLVIKPVREQEKEKFDWPPAKTTFVKIKEQRLRKEQKKNREDLLATALRKAKAYAEHHRETWGNREVVEVEKEWECPASPPNESSGSESGSPRSTPSDMGARSGSHSSRPRSTPSDMAAESGSHRSTPSNTRPASSLGVPIEQVLSNGIKELEVTQHDVCIGTED